MINGCAHILDGPFLKDSHDYLLDFVWGSLSIERLNACSLVVGNTNNAWYSKGLNFYQLCGFVFFVVVAT